MSNYIELKPFRFWCQKVLPLVYDDSLSYYELLCKVIDYLNKTMEDVETLHSDVENMKSIFANLKKWVEDYFKNLDIQDEVNKKLDEMAKDGTLTSLVYDRLKLVDKVDCWLYAQQATNEKSAQGFTIFVHNNVIKGACCFDGGIYLRNMLTGELINTVTNDNITHSNDITYYDNKMYLVNGDDNKVIGIELESYNVNVITVDNKLCNIIHGIEYYEDNFYLLCNYNGQYIIVKCDTGFENFTRVGNVNYGKNVSAKQGIFIHGGYLFLVGGRNNRTDIQGWYNILNVYNVKNCSFVKNIYVPFGMELEGVGYYNGEFYFYYNAFSQAGIITKGNLFYSEESYGIYPEHKLGFGRFNNSVNVYINEEYEGFFLSNTEAQPFKYWSEANAFMTNYDVPYYHLFLLSDINSRDLVANSNGEKALGIYSNNGVNINVTIDFRQFTNLHFSKINFNVDGTINQCTRVLFDACNIDASLDIRRASFVEFNSTNIMHNITAHYVTSIELNGTYTAINECINTNRLMSNIRVDKLPTNINELGLWKILTTSCNKYILTTVEMCKKIDDKHGVENQLALYLTNSDNILDLNVSGNYMLNSDHRVINAPDYRKSTLHLKQLYGVKYFTYTNALNNGIYYRTVDTNTGYDSGWNRRLVVNSLSNVNVYIDGVNGDDNNTGYSVKSPFKTFDRALKEYQNFLELRFIFIDGDTFDMNTIETFNSIGMHIANNTTHNITINWNAPATPAVYNSHINFVGTQNSPITIVSNSLYFDGGSVVSSFTTFVNDIFINYAGFEFNDSTFDYLRIYGSGQIRRCTFTGKKVKNSEASLFVGKGTIVIRTSITINDNENGVDYSFLVVDGTLHLDCSLGGTNTKPLSLQNSIVVCSNARWNTYNVGTGRFLTSCHLGETYEYLNS